MGNALTNELVEMISCFDEAKKDLTEMLEWQDSVKGRKSNLSKLNAMHKSVILKGWKARIHPVKKLISDARKMSNALVESINDSLLKLNLISSCPEDFLPNVESLLKN